MELDIGKILTQILAFLIMLWILKRFAWKPLLEILEERRGRIQSDFASIEEQKKEIKRQLEAYREKLESVEAQSRAKIQEAIEEGRNLSLNIQEEAHNQAKNILNKSREGIKREMIKAKMQLKKDIVNITIATTEKIIKEKLDVEKQEKLITEFVERAEK